MALDDEVAFAPALEQARLLREREISPVELTELYLRRIDTLNPKLGAYVTVADDVARAGAKDAEAQLSAGGDDLPPFLGVPISIKDLHDTAGIRTTHGCRAWADRVPAEDDVHIARIRDAGFVLLGKTVAPELGPINVSEPPGYPPGRNPWDPSRSCGGSSGGAAAGVVAGLCAVSHGSDGGGSIRNPSSWCGAFGIKPSRGRVTAAPHPNDGFSVLGPIARNVADAAALLDVMSGPAPGDLTWASPLARPLVDEIGVDPGRLRVALSTDPGIGPAGPIDVAPANVAAAEEAAKLLESLGHHVTVAQPPTVDPDVLMAMQIMFCADMAARELGDRLPPVDTLTPWSQSMIEMGRMVTGAAFIDAQRKILRLCRTVAAFFADYDLLVTPTVAQPPPEVGRFAEIDFSRIAELWGLTPFTGMWNTTGQPAVSLPWSLDPDGYPVGVQVVGPPIGEPLLVRVASQLENAHPWTVRPEVS